MFGQVLIRTYFKIAPPTRRYLKRERFETKIYKMKIDRD